MHNLLRCQALSPRSSDIYINADKYIDGAVFISKYKCTEHGYDSSIWLSQVAADYFVILTIVINLSE